MSAQRALWSDKCQAAIKKLSTSLLLRLMLLTRATGWRQLS